MKLPHPIVETVQHIRDSLYRLAREWEAAVEEIQDPDEQDALRLALCHKCPFGRDLDELVAEVDEWVEHVNNVMTNRPTVLQLVASELGEDGPQPALTSHLAGDLRNLLLAVDGGDSELVHKHAERLARDYRSASLAAAVARTNAGQDA